MSEKKWREFWIDKQWFVNGQHKTSEDQAFNCLVVLNPKDKSGDYMFKVTEYGRVEELEKKLQSQRDLNGKLADGNADLYKRKVEIEEREEELAEMLGKEIGKLRKRLAVAVEALEELPRQNQKRGYPTVLEWQVLLGVSDQALAKIK